MSMVTLFDAESSDGDSDTLDYRGQQKTLQCSGVFDSAVCTVYFSQDGVNYSAIDDLTFTVSGTTDTNLEPVALLLPPGKLKATISGATGNTAITLTVK